MKKLAIVILNWNTRDLLKKFVPGILASIEYARKETRHATIELIVADNASADGSMELMGEMFPDVKTIIMDKNYGFTGGYNRALEQIKDEYEYYILINSDIDVPRRWLKPLVEWMDSHPECGACAPKLHSWYEKDLFEYAGAAGGCLDRFGYPFCRGRIMSKIEKDYGQYDNAPREVFWASGACIMIRSKLFHKLGGLDDRFFAHMEEIDLCWRIQLDGHKICIVPESTVYHLGGGTLPSTSAWKLKLNFRNNLLMLSNNLAKSYGVLELKKNRTVEQACRKGWKKAERMIFMRMILDGCSALVYLLTFKKEYFNAVVQAHKEFKQQRFTNGEESLRNWLGEERKSLSIYAWSKEWIIPKVVLWGNNVFSHISRFYA